MTAQRPTESPDGRPAESPGTETSGTETSGTESLGTETSGTETSGTKSLGTETSGPGEPGWARRRTTALFAAVALFALAADQVTKAIALRELAPGQPVELVGSLLRLHLVRNSGAAFSIGTGFTLVLTLIATGIVVVVLRLARRLRSKLWTVALGLLVGGALGNLTDRYFREPGPLRGHVVDFLELPRWPIFNLADTAVVCAAALMVLQAFRGIALDGTRHKPAARKSGRD